VESKILILEQKMKIKEFSLIHDQKVKEILAFYKKRKNFKIKLAKHNYGFLNFDFERYFNQSKIRYFQVLKLLNFPKNKKILDIGGFFGLFALDAEELNNQVTVAEKFSYYDNYFNNIKNHLIKNDIKILDKDFVLEKYRGKKKYDIVTCLAVIEHLSDSPKILFENIKKLLTPKGSLIIDGPNLAFFGNRARLLLGKSFLPDITHIYRSAVPFTGHVHEYTIPEFYSLAKEAGFKVKQVITFNYALDSLVDKILYFPALIFPNAKDSITVKLTKK